MFHVSTIKGFLILNVNQESGITHYNATHNIRYAHPFSSFEDADNHAKKALPVVCEKDAQWFAVLKVAQSTD